MHHSSEEFVTASKLNNLLLGIYGLAMRLLVKVREIISAEAKELRLFAFLVCSCQCAGVQAAVRAVEMFVHSVFA